MELLATDGRIPGRFGEKAQCRQKNSGKRRNGPWNCPLPVRTTRGANILGISSPPASRVGDDFSRKGPAPKGAYWPVWEAPEPSALIPEAHDVTTVGDSFLVTGGSLPALTLLDKKAV